MPKKTIEERIVLGRLPAFADKLGTKNDSVLAEEFGVAANTIRRWRKALGIAPCRTHRPDTMTRRVGPSKYHGDFGKMSDADIAKKFGVSRQMVQYERQKAGVDKHQAEPKKPPYFDLLGQQSDHAVAKQFGVCVNTVRQARKTYSIACCPPKKTIIDESLLGTMSDERVAKLVGLSTMTIWKRRKKLGIKGVSEK